MNKKLTLIVIDIIFCITSIWFSMFLRLETFFPLFDLPIILVIYSSVLLIAILLIFSIYKTINRYSGWDSFTQLGKALIVYDLIFFCFFTIVSFDGIPRSIGLLHPMLLTLMILSSRVFIRLLFNYKLKNKLTDNILIYGAGEAGRQLASIIQFSKKMKLLGFLEDNENYIGQKINNKLIYNSKQLNNIKAKLKISTIILAIPSLSNKKKSQIIKNIQQHKLVIKTMPTLHELENENVSLSDLRSFNINELLGRNKVNTRIKNNSNYLLDKVVLITGAGGSIGSELCLQVINQNPNKIIMLDISEFALYKINQKLNENFSNNDDFDEKFVPILGSVQDKDTLENIFKKFNPDIIYHAAAYKHVPLVQINPIEGIKNNVLGTELLTNLALKYNSSKFVLISSDKAVRPTNIMGASKRFAELILQGFNDRSVSTTFTIVRFGNVLGSSGSVVPKFQKQIQKGGPITLTHKNVTRFFMTKEEAIHLIIQAGGLSSGGEVFILKMGKPIKIFQLAKTMILLSGKTIKDHSNPTGDIEIKITGLREGEKMYEELLIGSDLEKTSNKKISKANEAFLSKKEILNHLKIIKKHIYNSDIVKIDKVLTKIVTGYKNIDSLKKDEFN